MVVNAAMWTEVNGERQREGERESDGIDILVEEGLMDPE
jgi:hypothetical protein